MEDGNGQSLADVGGEARRIALVGVGGKADQVVDDDLDGAAYGEAGYGAQIQGFRPNALTGKRRIAMDEHRQHFGLPGFSQAHLLGTRTAHGDGIHRFQVTGVRYQVKADFSAAPGEELAGGADVIFHVASAQDAARVRIFELGKDIGGGFTEGVRHHVQASAMAHAHHGLLCAIVGGVVQHFIQKGNQDGDTFEREALGAEIARLNHLLEEIGLG